MNTDKIYCEMKAKEITSLKEGHNNIKQRAFIPWALRI